MKHIRKVFYSTAGLKVVLNRLYLFPDKGKCRQRSICIFNVL